MNRALWHSSATHSELRPVDQPDDATLVSVASRFSMISMGTERLVAKGLAANANSDIGAPYTEGSFGFPIKYGYSLVGRSAAGDLVHCLHPHQQIAYVNNQALFKVPDNVPERRATLLSNMETVITAAWDAGIDEHSEVVICGFGNIGALLAISIRLQYAVQPIIVETDEWRRSKARSLGFEALTPDQYQRTHACVVNTSCNAAGLQFCIDHCEVDGTVIELSWYGTTPLPLNLGGTFHRNRVRLVSSQVSTIPPEMRARETRESRKQLAADLLSDDSFDELLTNEVAFEDSPAFFDDVRRGTCGDGLTWLIRYQG